LAAYLQHEYAARRNGLAVHAAKLSCLIELAADLLGIKLTDTVHVVISDANANGHAIDVVTVAAAAAFLAPAYDSLAVNADELMAVAAVILVKPKPNALRHVTAAVRATGRPEANELI
jgi:hypothetical protein